MKSFKILSCNKYASSKTQSQMLLTLCKNKHNNLKKILSDYKHRSCRCSICQRKHTEMYRTALFQSLFHLLRIKKFINLRRKCQMKCRTPINFCRQKMHLNNFKGSKKLSSLILLKDRKTCSVHRFNFNNVFNNNCSATNRQSRRKQIN